MKKNDYFELVLNLMKYCNLTSEILKDALSMNRVKNIHTDLLKMDELRINSSRLYQDVSYKLNKELITPIDSHDFLILMQNINYIQDEIYHTLSLLNIYHIYDIPSYFNKISELLDECLKLLYEILEELRNFKKNDNLRLKIIEIKTFQLLIEKLYKEAIENLITTTHDYKKIITYHKIYDYLYRCFDLCLYTSDIIEQIIMKNS